MVVYAGQGDPRRSMALLWRTPWESAAHTAPGPKPELSIDLVVKAAIEVADADGMAARDTGVDSYNVSVAAGILLYDIMRRRAAGSH